MVNQEKLIGSWYLPENERYSKIYEEALQLCIGRVRRNLSVFTDLFPSACGKNGNYVPVENGVDVMGSIWTAGFWSGMIWMCYEATGEDVFRQAGLEKVGSFRRRLDENIGLNHHDIGFLYSTSCAEAYKLTGDSTALETGIMAAEKLAERFREVPGIIQRGGDLDDLNSPFTGDFIIDCGLNVPLLFWASRMTGNRKFYDMAYRHIKAAQKYLILPDASTYQHFKLDIHTGEPLGGNSDQGANMKGSCWARGQAWGIYSMCIAYSYSADPTLLESADCMARYFLNRLQCDHICNWDFLFREDSDQRDTSAAAIAVCGILELAGHLPLQNPARRIYEDASLQILSSLIRNYLYREGESETAFLKGGVYAYNTGLGVDEPNLWGDYFFLEALMRVTRSFQPCW